MSSAWNEFWEGANEPTPVAGGLPASAPVAHDPAVEVGARPHVVAVQQEMVELEIEALRYDFAVLRSDEVDGSELDGRSEALALRRDSLVARAREIGDPASGRVPAVPGRDDPDGVQTTILEHGPRALTEPAEGFHELASADPAGIDPSAVGDPAALLDVSSSLMMVRDEQARLAESMEHLVEAKPSLSPAEFTVRRADIEASNEALATQRAQLGERVAETIELGSRADLAPIGEHTSSVDVTHLEEHSSVADLAFGQGQADPRYSDDLDGVAPAADPGVAGRVLGEDEFRQDQLMVVSDELSDGAADMTGVAGLAMEEFMEDQLMVVSDEPPDGAGAELDDLNGSVIPEG